MIKESLQDKILFISHLNEAIQDKFLKMLETRVVEGKLIEENKKEK